TTPPQGTSPDWAAIARSGIFDADALAFGSVHQVPKYERAKVRRAAPGADSDRGCADGLGGVPAEALAGVPRRQAGSTARCRGRLPRFRGSHMGTVPVGATQLQCGRIRQERVRVVGSAEGVASERLFPHNGGLLAAARLLDRLSRSIGLPTRFRSAARLPTRCLHMLSRTETGLRNQPRSI